MLIRLLNIHHLIIEYPFLHFVCIYYHSKNTKSDEESVDFDKKVTFETFSRIFYIKKF